MKRDTLLDFFGDFAERPEGFLVYDDGFRVTKRTYQETARAAKALAINFRESGINKGDKILIWSENRPEWVVAFWACLLAGAVLVPVDYRVSSALLLRLRDKVGARIALIGDEVAWPEDIEPRPWLLREIEWPKNKVSAVEWPGITEADVAEIIFTSGATSDPKGVIITHRNILANIVPIEKEVLKYYPWGRPFYPIRFLNLLPLSHMFGQSLATFIPPMLKGVTIFMRGHNPEDILRQIRTRRVSVLVSVPQILEVLRIYVLRLFPEIANAPQDRAKWPKRWWRYRKVHRLFGWKFWAFVVGSAPLPADLEEFWSRLGFLVIQGYGLTETAPIVTLNHPFHARSGTVGTPIGGVKVKIAPDGEILVRGENVTPGYYASESGAEATPFDDGWLHTGDIGEIDAEGRLIVRGRKKEMIVTPEGLNVFPEDVERALNQIPGVKDSAAVGRDRVHAVLVIAPGADRDEIVRIANGRLEDHQRIRGVSVWPGDELPRTEGTRKLKRQEIARWVESGGRPSDGSGTTQSQGKLETALARYAAGRTVAPTTTLEELGLSSLERVELMIELGIDESRFQQAQTVEDLMEDVRSETLGTVEKSVTPQAKLEFPRWNRSRFIRLVRDFSLLTWILPIGRIFICLSVKGREHLNGLEPPVIFASNHQSLLDVPAILMALPFHWRRRVAIAMGTHHFAPYFHPQRYSFFRHMTSALSYHLASLFFNTFPLPQREAGTLETLRYSGELASEGWCILIFPEGRRTVDGSMFPFQPGVGMMAARLHLPVVPARLEGLERILHEGGRMAHPGRVSVTFGAPLYLDGDDYAALARQVEEAVRAL